MNIKSMKNYLQLKKLLVVFLLLNLIVPKSFGSVVAIESDSVTDLIKNQGMVFYYSSFSTIPLKVISKILNNKKHDNCNNCDHENKDEDSKKSAEASSEFSLIRVGAKIKTVKTKNNVDNNKAVKVHTRDLNLKETEVIHIAQGSIIGKSVKDFIIALPRAGISNEIIYMAVNI